MSSVIGVSLTLPRHEFVVSQHKKASISPLDDQGKSKILTFQVMIKRHGIHCRHIISDFEDG